MKRGTSASRKYEHTHDRGMLRGKLRLFMLVGFLLLFLIAFGVISTFLFEIEDVIYAEGKIASELDVELIAHVDGRVTKLCFEEGQDVKAGDTIAELDAIAYDEAHAKLKAELGEFEAELEVRKAELAALKANPLPKELWYAETNLKESTDKAQRTQGRLDRSLRLAGNNAISKREFEDAEIENIKAQAELARARENLVIVQKGLGERNIEKAERDVDLVRAKIEGRRGVLAILERQIADCRIVAPVDGRLVSLPCKYTMYVQKGIVAAQMSSGVTVKGLAYVNESVVRKVRRGQEVRISSGVFNRLEYGSFYGKVDRVYDAPVEVTGLTLYPVEITIDSQGKPLKLGSSARFAIVAGREPVIFTILNLTKEPKWTEEAE